ncbi:hypothetical protein [Fundidesulfovibrio agrisoli]|uniref:hypothetical protein n=1 Tax=Fundidesulfovibrio agrisoli TaxID=2922717 RepID=UPI001FAC4F42|nr:hypothetical protein [Fundidesulfovibrio agrisoli]
MRLILRGLIAFLALVVLSHAAEARFVLVQGVEAVKGAQLQQGWLEAAKARVASLLE